MKLVGFNYSKISVEKLKALKDAKIDTKINLANLKEVSSGTFKSKDEIIAIEFNYYIGYEPEMAKINLDGNLLIALEPKKAKQIVKDWKNKTLDEDFKFNVLTIILNKANVKALELEEEMNLPYHLPLTSLKKPSKN